MTQYTRTLSHTLSHHRSERDGEEKRQEEKYTFQVAGHKLSSIANLHRTIDFFSSKKSDGGKTVSPTRHGQSSLSVDQFIYQRSTHLVDRSDRKARFGWHWQSTLLKMINER